MTQNYTHTRAEAAQLLIAGGATFSHFSGKEHPVYELNGRRIAIPRRDVSGRHGRNMVAEVRKFLQTARATPHVQPAPPSAPEAPADPSAWVGPGAPTAAEREAAKRTKAEARAAAQLATLQPVFAITTVLDSLHIGAHARVFSDGDAVAPQEAPMPDVPVAPESLAERPRRPLPPPTPPAAEPPEWPKVCPEPGCGFQMTTPQAAGGHAGAHTTLPTFPCPHGCGWTYQRRVKSYYEHVDHECPRRPTDAPSLDTAVEAEQALAASLQHRLAAVPPPAADLVKIIDPEPPGPEAVTSITTTVVVTPPPAPGALVTELRAALALMEECLANHEAQNALLRDCLAAFAKVEARVAAHERVLAVLRAEGLL